ncbi:MAG: ATP-binding protein [Kofleriaceae bacterium]
MDTLFQIHGPWYESGNFMNLPDGAVFEAMVDVVLIVDVAGHIVLANSATERITGYTQSELRELPATQLLDDEHSGIRTRVRQRIASGDIMKREDSHLVTKAGERIPVAITGSPLFDDQQQLVWIVLVARDVRELRRAEAELRDALASIEDRLEQTRGQLLLAERRATLGTLAGGVGHELNNIAQVQIAAVEVLAESLGNIRDEDVRLALRDLERVADHVQLHANRLTRLARPGPDHVQPTKLDLVIREVVAMLRGAGRLRKIEIEVSTDDASRLVTVNRTRIEQILVNLVVNAADAIVRPGTITIRVHGNGDRVHVEVTDTGSGMTPEVMARIFEPFFTTKGEDAGTGLGLPVVREIVESYGGKLTVESSLGAGSTFRFDLPLSSGLA